MILYTKYVIESSYLEIETIKSNFNSNDLWISGVEIFIELLKIQ